MRKIFLVALASLGLMACSNDDSNSTEQDFEPVTLDISTLLQDTILHNNLGGNGQEGIGAENRVISNVSQWNQLIDEIDYTDDGVNGIVATLEAVTIDFDNEDVLAVFEEIKNYGGYSIDIVKVEEQEKKVVVTIDRLLKGGDATVITQPFHIVKIAKVNKPIVFVEVE